jgi:hypothetical protein
MNSNFIIFILVLIILYLYLNKSQESSVKHVSNKGSIYRNDIINKIDPKQFNPAIHHPACL